MRRCTSILILCLSLVSASAARAAVQFKGLQFSPLGACVVDVGADGMLDLSNIGSSGQDGVSIDCLHMDGAMLSLSGVASSEDVGAECSATFRCRLNGLPPGTPVLSRLAFTVSPSSLDFTCVCSPELSSSTTQTVTLYRGGVAVYSAVLDVSVPVSVQMNPATGDCPMPAMGAYVKGRKDMLQWRASFPSSVVVTVAGHSEDCDDFVVSRSSPWTPEVCDGEDCELLVRSGSGAQHHFVNLRCDDGACRVLHHWVQATGTATVTATVDASGKRRLPVNNLGSSGQDGIEVVGHLGGGGGGGAGIVPPPADVDGDGLADDVVQSPPSLVFDPSLDAGASMIITVSGTWFSSSGASQSSASVRVRESPTEPSRLQILPDHSSLGATIEAVAVLRHGVVVASGPLPPGSSLEVSATPGGSPTFAIASCGPRRGGCCVGHVTLIKTPQTGARPALPASSSSSSVDASCPMEVSFRCDRVFVFGGVTATGDQVVCWGDDAGGANAGTFSVSSTACRVTCPNPASPLSAMELLDVAGSMDAIGPVVGGSSVSLSNTCASIPFSFLRSDVTPVRGFSVTFHLSPELSACGARVTEGDYLSSVAGTQFYLSDNGGGSYTADCSILGPVCGATGSGTLFTLQVGAAAGVTSGMGTVTVDNVVVRDCGNQPVPAVAGDVGYVPIQLVAPAPVSGLTATQQKSGNPSPGSTTGVQLKWSRTNGVSLYRHGFGNYPLYDNAPTPGSVPSPPVSPAAALASGWTPVSCSSGACAPDQLLDSPSSRDFLYYVAFATDVFGNPSSVSSMTPGTLDYHLGDVSDGSATCSGDNHVDMADISLLGSNYGTAVSSGGSSACVDVGPTTDYSVDARPTTDGTIGFEDLMVFSINFSVVSAPQAAARPAALAGNAARLALPATLPAVGGTFDAALQVDGAGDAQGMSVRLAYDPAVVEQVGVAGGELLAAQGRPGIALSSGPGHVDAALLGTGAGIAGSGDLARVTFRVKAPGDAQLAIAGVSARGADNRPVPIAGADAGAAADARTGLGVVFPNPFRAAVEIRMSMRRDGPASLAVYDIAGRRVHTLLRGMQPAGVRTVTWDGTDDAGLRLAPGAYLVRLDAGDRHETRTVRLVR